MLMLNVPCGQCIGCRLENSNTTYVNVKHRTLDLPPGDLNDSNTTYVNVKPGQNGGGKRGKINSNTTYVNVKRIDLDWHEKKFD